MLNWKKPVGGQAAPKNQGCLVGCLGCFILVLAIIIIGVIRSNVYHTPAPPPATQKAALSQTQIQEIEKIIADGLKMGVFTKINPQFNEAFVEPSLWNPQLYDTKASAARTLALYCQAKKGTNTCWVEIKDCYSGKVIAKYSETFGFKTY